MFASGKPNVYIPYSHHCHLHANTTLCFTKTLNGPAIKTTWIDDLGPQYQMTRNWLES